MTPKFLPLAYSFLFLPQIFISSFFLDTPSWIPPRPPLWALSLSSLPASRGLPISMKDTTIYLLPRPETWASFSHLQHPINHQILSSLPSEHLFTLISSPSPLHLPYPRPLSFLLITALDSSLLLASSLHRTAWVTFPKHRCDHQIPLLQAQGYLPSSLGVNSKLLSYCRRPMWPSPWSPPPPCFSNCSLWPL